jgi:hypothetical protein
LVKSEQLEKLRTRLLGLGHDAEVQVLFGYIATLEERLETLAQYYEEFVIPELEWKTWAAARAYERGDREAGR